MSLRPNVRDPARRACLDPADELQHALSVRLIHPAKIDHDPIGVFVEVFHHAQLETAQVDGGCVIVALQGFPDGFEVGGRSPVTGR